MRFGFGFGFGVGFDEDRVVELKVDPIILRDCMGGRWMIGGSGVGWVGGWGVGKIEKR